MDKYNSIIFEKDLYINRPNVIEQHEIGETISIAGNDFIIIHKGRPNSSAYDETCDGVWLMRKAVLGARPFDADGNPSYEGSDLDSYLNDTFIPMFGTAADNFKTINLPVNGGTIARKGFCLSAAEFGLNSASETLDYFKKDRNNIVQSWTRTKEDSYRVYTVQAGDDKIFSSYEALESFPVYLCIVVPFGYSLGGSLAKSAVAKADEVNAINTKLARYICENEDDIDYYASYMPAEIVRRRFPDEEGSPVYGFAQVIVSGYIKIDNGANAMYFSNDITRQLQGIPVGTDASFVLTGVAGVPQGGLYAYQLYMNAHANEERVFGHHFNVTFSPSYAKVINLITGDMYTGYDQIEASNIKARTWLFREYQMI